MKGLRLGLSLVGRAAVGVAAAHRYWRVYCREGGASSLLNCAELEMRTSAGGADVTSSAFAIKSNERTGELASSAFDNSTATYWQCDGTAGQWIGQDFGAGNEQQIVEISWQVLSGQSARAVREGDVQYSDDGSTWTTAWSWSFTGWTNSAKVFTKPGATPSRYWRLRVDTVQNAGTSTSCAEMELRASIGGSDETGSGTASARTTFSGSAASNAFDNSASTLWASGTGVDNCEWLAYDFGAGVTKNIQQISFTARNDTSYTQSPTAGWVESGDDGTNWISRWTFSGLSWTQGSTNVFHS